MKIRTLLVWLCLGVASGAQAQLVRLVLLNNSDTFMQVLKDDRSVLAAIAPNTSTSITISQLQWMRQGNKTLRYNMLAVQRLHRKGQEVVLQFGPKTGLYLLPPETATVMSPPPPQPKGFPLRPDRTFVLR